MAPTDAVPPRTKSPLSKSDVALPIGAGSVETSEMDCTIIRESALPKWHVGPPTGGFPQRTLPPLFPPSTPSNHDKIVKTSYLPTPIETHPVHPFIFHEEPPQASRSKSPSSTERPHKRKRCSGLTKSDKLALITICTKHKADYKQGDKTGFWELVKKSMLAETGKELAQPRSMVERWCSWEIDQTLERQTTDDQQDFRLAVKDFCARWKEVRQEYNSRRQSKANTTADGLQTRADQHMGNSRTDSPDYTHGDKRMRVQSIPGEAVYSVQDFTAGGPNKEHRFHNHVLNRSISDSRVPRSDATTSNIPRTNARASNPTSGDTCDKNTHNGNPINRSSLDRDTIPRNTLNGSMSGGTSSNGILLKNKTAKSNASNENTTTGNKPNYKSPYPWAHRIAPATAEFTGITSGGTLPSNPRLEIPGASLPTPRASISGSQSSTSSPISSMDIRRFPPAKAETMRTLIADNAQSSSLVGSLPIDDLAQAYVARTHEASFDILREIMTRHDEIVRRLSASKALLAEDFEASKRHIGVVERELEITRSRLKQENANLMAELDKSELHRFASIKMIGDLELEKAGVVRKLQGNEQHSSQLPPVNELSEKEPDEINRPSLQISGEKTVPEAQSEAVSKKTATEKELEACQRQIVKIKNEKSVLELELSVSKRQIQELKAQIPNLIERPETTHSPHDATNAMSEKTI